MSLFTLIEAGGQQQSLRKDEAIHDKGKELQGAIQGFGSGNLTKVRA